MSDFCDATPTNKFAKHYFTTLPEIAKKVGFYKTSVNRAHSNDNNFKTAKVINFIQ